MANKNPKIIEGGWSYNWDDWNELIIFKLDDLNELLVPQLNVIQITDS